MFVRMALSFTYCMCNFNVHPWTSDGHELVHACPQHDSQSLVLCTHVLSVAACTPLCRSLQPGPKSCS